MATIPWLGDVLRATGVSVVEARRPRPLHIPSVFADPALLRRLYKQRLLDYLNDDSVSPLPFRRLDRDPDRALTKVGWQTGVSWQSS